MHNSTNNIDWKLMCEQFMSSGTTKKQFCLDNNITEGQLYYYLYKLKPEAIRPIKKTKVQKSTKKITSFLPVKYKPTSTTQELKIKLTTGHVLSFAIPTEQIPAFIKQMESSYESSCSINS